MNLLNKNTFLIGLAALATTAGFTSCRGEMSRKPPIHIVQNMDFQEKLKAQSASEFEGWGDHRGMRMPVRGTIAQGQLRQLDKNTDVAKFHIYKDASGKHLTANPLPKTRENLMRGKERYQIHCAVCHGDNARGRGIVGRRFSVKPPSLVKASPDDHPKTRAVEGRVGYPDGQYFDIITNGSGNMKPYKYQVDAKDRWAIIHYLRALQLRAASN